MNQHDMIAAIAVLFPTAQNEIDYTIKVTNNVPVLQTWNNSLGAQPTQEQIQASLDAIQLAGYQRLQSSVIEASYQTQVANGFTSSALGQSYLYPSTATDQANLTAVVTASMIPGQPSDWTTLFWCAPTATPTAWNYVSHTAAQIQKVGIDAMGYIMNTKMHRAQRNGQIQAATTVAAVQAIVW